MYKLMGLLRRKDGMSHEQFVTHWKEVHSEIARKIPGLRAYRLSPLDVRFEGGGIEYDGYGELWFDSREDFEAATQSEAWRAARADVPNFKSEGPLFLCEEEIDIVSRHGAA